MKIRGHGTKHTKFTNKYTVKEVSFRIVTSHNQIQIHVIRRKEKYCKLLRKLIPVSYTHLDVYKRQDL